MVIFNKLVMQTFPYPNLLLIIQNSITIMLNLAGTSIGTSHPTPTLGLSSVAPNPPPGVPAAYSP